jgi:CMP/dCMP kinase
MAIVIAIDGPAGAGKSTVARRLAARLGYTYIDTGAMYRAVALWALRQSVDLSDMHRLDQLAQAAAIELDSDQERVLLNDEDVTEAIRTPEVGLAASQIAAVPAVRRALVSKQRTFAERQNVVMEGRDIGTVVFPDAELKLFLEASEQARAGRRWREEAGKEIEHYVTQVDKNMPPEEEILRQLRERDDRDRSRAASPLHAAEDAVVLDTTALDEDAVLAEVLKVIASRWPDLPVRRARGERGEPLAPAGPAGPRGES